MQGKLIVIEGTDGSGKSTQLALLVKRLKKESHQVATIHFPQYGKYSAVFAEKYLKGEYGPAEEVGPYTASLFYALDRFAAKQKLQQWLEQGKIVIVDRYVSANEIHQAGKIKDPKKLDRFLEWLEDIEFEKNAIPRPDLVLFLNVPPHIGQQLVQKRKQGSTLKRDNRRDIHEEDEQHLLESYRRACYLVKKRKNWREIVCTRDGDLLPIPVIAEKIWRHVARIV